MAGPSRGPTPPRLSALMSLAGPRAPVAEGDRDRRPRPVCNFLIGKAQITNPAQRCAWCGAPWAPVWVHGHGQCSVCGINAAPCCEGAECET